MNNIDVPMIEVSRAYLAMIHKDSGLLDAISMLNLLTPEQWRLAEQLAKYEAE